MTRTTLPLLFGTASVQLTIREFLSQSGFTIDPETLLEAPIDSSPICSVSPDALSFLGVKIRRASGVAELRFSLTDPSMSLVVTFVESTYRWMLINLILTHAYHLVEYSWPDYLNRLLWELPTYLHGQFFVPYWDVSQAHATLYRSHEPSSRMLINGLTTIEEVRHFLTGDDPNGQP